MPKNSNFGFTNSEHYQRIISPKIELPFSFILKNLWLLGSQKRLSQKSRQDSNLNVPSKLNVFLSAPAIVTLA